LCCSTRYSTAFERWRIWPRWPYTRLTSAVPPCPNSRATVKNTHRRTMIEGLEPCGTARSATASSSFRKSVIMASRPVRNDGNSRRVGGRSVLNT